MHGIVKDGWLIKRGKQVVKFWKYNGYAIPVEELRKVKGVVLHTQYDGILYQTSEVIFNEGIKNMFKEEEQLVLPSSMWEIKDEDK